MPGGFHCVLHAAGKSWSAPARGVAYMRQTEEAYAAQVRDRLEKQLQRRAKELGYELKKIEPNLETLIVIGEELTLKADGEIVAAK
jgi:hypothetical protein